MAVQPKKKRWLLKAAEKLVYRRALEALTGLLRADHLAAQTVEDGNPVSRQTAYRLWPGKYDAVGAASRRAADPKKSGADADLDAAVMAYYKAIANHAGADVSLQDQQEMFRSVLAANFERQFESVGMAVGWVLHAAALTSSPLWRGERPDPEVAEIGQQVLADRGALFEHIADSWAGLLSEAMATYGRRPKAPYDVEDIVKVMHCMADGSLLHIFVAPELNDPSIGEQTRARRRRQAVAKAVDAMVHLAWVYTEPGSLDDPRRPTSHDEVVDLFERLVNPLDDRGRPVSREELVDPFERLVDAAAVLYAIGEHDLVDPDEAAAAAELPPEMARKLFPEPGDLADSVVRRLVAPAGAAFSTAGIPMVRSVLGRLHRAAATHPQVFEAVGEHPPTTPSDPQPFLDELADRIGAALQASEANCDEHHETARTLIRCALDGDEGQAKVDAEIDRLTSGPG